MTLPEMARLWFDRSPAQHRVLARIIWRESKGYARSKQSKAIAYGTKKEISEVA